MIYMAGIWKFDFTIEQRAVLETMERVRFCK